MIDSQGCALLSAIIQDWSACICVAACVNHAVNGNKWDDVPSCHSRSRFLLLLWQQYATVAHIHTTQNRTVGPDISSLPPRSKS